MPSATVPMCTLAQIAVEQVGDDLLLAGREHLFGNLAAGLEAACPGSVTRPRPRAILNSSSLSASASMMNPRSAPVTSIAESMHERQHLVEHAARSERAQAFEQRRHLAEVADGRRRVLLGRTPALRASSSRNTISAPPLRPRRMQVAVLQRLLGDALRR